MHLEFLLEEQSMEAALLELVPKVVPDHSFKLHPHRGKPDLLGKLEGRLRGYARWNVPDAWVVVIVDRDADDCHALKQSLLAVCATVGVPALCRIAIEERAQPATSPTTRPETRTSRLDGSMGTAAKLQSVATRLETAGCPVQRSGQNGWMAANSHRLKP